MKITKQQLRKIIKEEFLKEAEFGAWMGKQGLGDDSPPVGRDRFTGGSVDIEPLGGAAQEVFEDAYYDLFDYLRSGPGEALPGEKPSEKLKFALRWIAKFELGGEG